MTRINTTDYVRPSTAARIAGVSRALASSDSSAAIWRSMRPSSSELLTQTRE